jgi:hypothetical protein
MAGPKRSPSPNHAASIVESVNRLVDAVTGLLGSIGHAAAGAAVRLKDAGAGGVAKAPEAVAKTSERLRRAVATTWARYTPAEREARIRKMLAGRGLKPKGAAKGKGRAKARARRSK